MRRIAVTTKMRSVVTTFDVDVNRKIEFSRHYTTFQTHFNVKFHSESPYANFVPPCIQPIRIYFLSFKLISSKVVPLISKINVFLVAPSLAANPYTLCTLSI
jgi:hypothetical protein